MKILSKVLLLGCVTLFLACGASQKLKEPNTTLDEMMNQKTFEIKVITAQPRVTQAMSQVANSGLLAPGNSIGRIDVTGLGYFIKVYGDSVSGNLPYYGERQMGGGYNSNSGIKFDGIAQDFKIAKNEEKQTYTVRFSVDSDSENFFVIIGAGTNLTSVTNIQSSHRNQIRYSGNVVAVED